MTAVETVTVHTDECDRRSYGDDCIGGCPVLPEAQAALAYTSTRDLLRQAYALTHRIHAAEDRAASLAWSGQSVAAGDRRSLATDLRAQRDLITAEVIRRAGE